MSVPSSKMIVTPEMPNCENDRTSLIGGMPFIAFSTGIVMNCSTSSGPRAGALVSAITWTLVMSGTASIGRFSSEKTPEPASPRSRRRTKPAVLSETRSGGRTRAASPVGRGSGLGSGTGERQGLSLNPPSTTTSSVGARPLSTAMLSFPAASA